MFYSSFLQNSLTLYPTWVETTCNNHYPHSSLSTVTLSIPVRGPTSKGGPLCIVYITLTRLFSTNIVEISQTIWWMVLVGSIKTSESLSHEIWTTTIFCLSRFVLCREHCKGSLFASLPPQEHVLLHPPRQNSSHFPLLSIFIPADAGEYIRS